MSAGNWQATRWWRVMRNGKLWAETSDEDEARRICRPGDVLQRYYERIEGGWRDERQPK